VGARLPALFLATPETVPVVRSRLTESGPTAANAGHLLTAAAIWLGVPLVLGIRRIRIRLAEIK
jgi:hypothetical protein